MELKGGTGAVAQGRNASHEKMSCNKLALTDYPMK